MTIRRAGIADVAVIHALLCELAEFEGGMVAATVEDLTRDGFGARPLFEVLLAEEAGAVAGMLVFFATYSSWQGRPGVMIHDLYVRPNARGKGIGAALVRALAAVVRERGGGRMDVCVLDWNTQAQAFYERLGLRPAEGWLIRRVEDDALDRLATSGMNA